MRDSRLSSGFDRYWLGPVVRLKGGRDGRPKRRERKAKNTRRVWEKRKKADAEHIRKRT